MRMGFTLIELLVVIAIIAILAAILFPVFAKAREKARQTACLSNLKQMGTAFLMYCQDYDEHPPIEYPCRAPWIPSNYGANGCAAYNALNALQPYIGNWQMLRCPDYVPGASSVYPGTNIKGFFFAKCWGDTPGLRFDGGYAINENLQVMCGWDRPDTFRRYLPIGAYKNPAHTIYAGDVSPPFSYNNTFCAWHIKLGEIGGCPGGCFPREIPGRHNGGDNFMFLDGHAKWMRKEVVEIDFSWWTPQP